MLHHFCVSVQNFNLHFSIASEYRYTADDNDNFLPPVSSNKVLIQDIQNQNFKYSGW